MDSKWALRFLPLRVSNSSTVAGSDVFREAFDQAVAFGERGTAFEEQTWATGLQFIEERI
jgi:hypothetical protein